MNNIFVRTVSGYEREYVVSNCGDVFSMPRKGAWIIKKLKTQINHNGYERVALTKCGKKKYMFVHRIVAENFIDNPFEKKTVNHIDGNKINNNIENLEWATHSENSQHAVDNNLMRRAKGGDMSKVLNEDDVLKIIEMRKSGMTHKNIGFEIGRPKSTIQCILNGRRWSHATGIKYGVDKPL